MSQVQYVACGGTTEQKAFEAGDHAFSIHHPFEGFLEDKTGTTPKQHITPVHMLFYRNYPFYEKYADFKEQLNVVGSHVLWHLIVKPDAAPTEFRLASDVSFLKQMIVWEKVSPIKDEEFLIVAESVMEQYADSLAIYVRNHASYEVFKDASGGKKGSPKCSPLTYNIFYFVLLHNLFVAKNNGN